MEINGTINENLRLAVRSARRLKGYPISRDIVRFWSDLLREARARRSREQPSDQIELDQLIAELEIVLADEAS